MATSTSLMNSFIPATTREWNKLPREAKEAKTQENFLEHFPERERPPSYHYIGTRRGQILQTRIRLRCSALNGHLAEKNLVESPDCGCGNSKETPEHYLLECDDYIQLREEMFDELHFLPTVNCHTLLYGTEDITNKQNEELFKAVQKFILKSERFG